MAMTQGQSDPVDAWQWDIRSGRLSTYEFPWPGGLTEGDRGEALDAWGFQEEFVATPEARELGPRVVVYSRFLPDDAGDGRDRESKAMPFQYCIVVEMSTSYELIFAAGLPELVDALRYLAPLITS
jgi:hypothetical protein